MTDEEREDMIHDLERIKERIELMLDRLKNPVPQPLSGGGPGEEH